jgi:curved DNA-binding protein CbpA
MQNYYQILGVSSSAKLDDIKKAYRKLARTNHPDKAQDENDKKRLEEEFAAITTAYNTLKDEEARKAYDATLAKSAGTPPDSGGGAPAGALSASAAGAGPSASAAGTGNKSATGAPPAGVDLEKGRKDVAMRAFAQGIKLYQLADYNRAADFFYAATKSYPEEAQFQDRLAVCLLKARKDFSNAVSAAMKASELDPYKSEYKIHLAELYEAIGSDDKALQTYKELLNWDPENLVAKAKVNAAAEAASPIARFKKWYLKLVGR